MHFPFHVALVLLMEGINQFVSWRHVIEYVNNQFSAIDNVLNNSTSTAADVYNTWNQTIDEVLENPDFSVSQELWDNVQSSLALLNPTSNATVSQQENASLSIIENLFTTIFDGYDFEPPESDGSQSLDQIYNSYYDVFELVFGYFFICAGLVLIAVAILSYVSLLKDANRETRHRYVGIIGNVVLGLALTMLSTMVLTQAADNLGESVWTLPLLVFVLFIALLLNHVPRTVEKVSKE